MVDWIQIGLILYGLFSVVYDVHNALRLARDIRRAVHEKAAK